jgi:nucleotide-binding universal stress UspA family protein
VELQGALGRLGGSQAAGEEWREAATLLGAAAAQVLAESRRWHADLVVLGRSGQHSRSATPGLGSQVRHVLEFTDVPVLVVPAGTG